MEFPGCLDEKKTLINSRNNETNPPKTSGISEVFRYEKTMCEGGNSETNLTKTIGIPKCLKYKKTTKYEHG